MSLVFLTVTLHCQMLPLTLSAMARLNIPPTLTFCPHWGQLSLRFRSSATEWPRIQGKSANVDWVCFQSLFLPSTCLHLNPQWYKWLFPSSIRPVRVIMSLFSFHAHYSFLCSSIEIAFVYYLSGIGPLLSCKFFSTFNRTLNEIERPSSSM